MSRRDLLAMCACYALTAALPLLYIASAYLRGWTP